MFHRFEKYSVEGKVQALMGNVKKLSSVLQTKEIIEKYMLLKGKKSQEIGNVSVSKTRKRRTNFNPETVQMLNEVFRQNAHPSVPEIEEMSRQTGYSFQEIKVWFNNKRQSSKHQNSSD